MSNAALVESPNHFLVKELKERYNMFKINLILVMTVISAFQQICSQDLLRAEYEKCLMEDIEYQDCLLEAHWNSLNNLSNNKKDIDKMEAGFRACKDRLKTRLCPIIKDIFER